MPKIGMPQQGAIAPGGRPGNGMPPPMMQVVSSVHIVISQPQLVFELGWHAPAQHDWPASNGPGAAHERPRLPHWQMPPLQFGPVKSQTRPHMPQLFGSVSVLMQVPLQQLWPAAQADAPHTQRPPEHVSPIAQRRPIIPQLFGSVIVEMHWKAPIAFCTHCEPPLHAAAPPHTQPTMPPAPEPHALAVIGSQARPQSPQFMNDGSLRASTSAEGAVRFTHVVPQQRCDELQSGMHMPGIPGPASRGPTVPVSRMIGVPEQPPERQV